MILLARQAPHFSATAPYKFRIGNQNAEPRSEFEIFYLSIGDGRSPWCCPRHTEFWKLCCTAGARPLTPHAGSSVVHFQVCVLRSAILNSKLVRLPGVAPGHALWRRAILLLNHGRMESKRAGSVLFHTPGPRHFNKEQTPLAILRYQPTVSRWFFRCLGAHLLRSP